MVQIDSPAYYALSMHKQNALRITKGSNPNRIGPFILIQMFILWTSMVGLFNSWITPEIRRKIRRKNKTHAKAKKTGSNKLRSKFETLRREIKADVRKQHDLYVNNLVGDVKANPRDFYRYINSQKKDTQGIPP